MPTAYRFEIAKQGRAGCSNKACKDEGVKILKGELRFGVLVTIQEHDSWKWRHWGCVTPQIIHNVMEQVGEDIDLDEDIDVLDGADELESWAQDKVKQALRQGHVDDEDWKGDPELNRPGQKGFKKRTPKKKAKDSGDEEVAEDATSPVPRAKKSTKSRKVKSEDKDVGGNGDVHITSRSGRAKKVKLEDDEHEKPAKKPTGRKRKAMLDEEVIKAESVESSPEPPAKRSKSALKARATDDVHDAKPKRGRKLKQQQADTSEEDTALPHYKGATSTTDKPLKKSTKAKQAQEDAEKENNEAEEEPADPKVGKKSRTKQTDESNKTGKEQNPAKRGRKPKPTSEDEAENGDEHDAPVVKKRGRKSKA